MKKAASLILVIAMIFLLSSCGNAINESRIEGSWTSQTKIISGIVTETKFTFNEGGTGSISTVLGINIPMEYTIDGTELAITTDTPLLQKTLEYEFEISGDELILYDSSDNEIVFTKVDR